LSMRPPITLSGRRLGDRVRTATQALADEFSGFISAHPADWHMLQPFWLADSAGSAGTAGGSAALRPSDPAVSG
jgi:phosphatidylinositol dimannoside acyltransferase